MIFQTVMKGAQLISRKMCHIVMKSALIGEAQPLCRFMNLLFLESILKMFGVHSSFFCKIGYNLFPIIIRYAIGCRNNAIGISLFLQIIMESIQFSPIYAFETLVEGIHRQFVFWVNAQKVRYIRL